MRAAILVVAICPSFSDLMARSPMVVIELPLEQRIEGKWDEYVIDRYQKTMAYHGENGEEEFPYLIDSLMRVKKRLGGTAYQGNSRPDGRGTGPPAAG